jgi:hypothetical protein
MLWLSRPATHKKKNRTVGSHDKTQGEQKQKKTFSHNILEIGGGRKRIQQKTKQIQAKPRSSRADSNTTASSATPSRGEETPTPRMEGNKDKHRNGSERGGGEEPERDGPERRGEDSRIGSGNVGAFEL